VGLKLPIFGLFYDDIVLKQIYFRNKTRYRQTEKVFQLQMMAYIPSKFGELWHTNG